MLGIAFGVCFVTGLLSHWIQHPPSWFWWPSRPVALYRVTQGLHVASGLAAIPLLSAKLRSVYHRLFVWPPARDVWHALERASIAVLVACGLFELVTGLLNIALWYGAMPFAFIAAHYWTAWLAIGALLLHVAVKLPLIREGLSRPSKTDARPPAEADASPAGPPTGADASRRGVLAAVAATAGIVTLATVGQTVRPLRYISVLAPRRPDIGPQGLPVNGSASAKGVTVDPAWRLVVEGPAGRLELTLDDLAGLPQHTYDLPITCVEGWSAGAVWTGVPVRDLLDRVGIRDAVRVDSLQAGYSSILPPPHTRDPRTLLALRLHGEPLHLDHGFPGRLIAPNRPGVLQIKWVKSLTVVRS